MRALNLILQIPAMKTYTDDENLFTNSDFCGIQTHDLCLVTGHHNLTKECNFQDEGFQLMH